jgi:hypothetical protein
MFGIQMFLPPAPAPESISGVAPHNLRLPPLPAPASTSAILRAPLFTPSRTFDADVTITTNSDNTGVAFELLGISSVRGNKRAFLKLSNGSVESLGLGGKTKGWLLTALGQNSARLSRDGQTITLQAGVVQSESTPVGTQAETSEENVQ